MRDQCLAAGMDDFVTKPFDDLQLTEALRRRLTPTGASAAGDLLAPAIAKASDNLSAAEAVEPLNPAALSQIKTIEARGSKGLPQRVVAKFSDTAPPLAAEIKARFDARDGEALWRAAHALKSAASAVGAAQVSLRCNDIEMLVRHSGADAASALIGSLDAEIAIAIKSLQAFVTDADAAVH